MIMGAIYWVTIVVVCALVPVAHAQSMVEIVMEQTTFSYCEKLVYTIKVSEVTGDDAIVHITDNTGKTSSAIPIGISDHETLVPALVAFSKDVFPLGEYLVEVQYSGNETAASFTLIDSGKHCLPELVKPYIANWIEGYVSNGIVIDVFEKYVDKEFIEIPFQITAQNVNDVQIPSWVKHIGFWWISGLVSDEEFVDALAYLMDKGIITVLQN